VTRWLAILAWLTLTVGAAEATELSEVGNPCGPYVGIAVGSYQACALHKGSRLPVCWGDTTGDVLGKLRHPRR
jgi:hypothetical protein